jgi:hypothetical protein
MFVAWLATGDKLDDGATHSKSQSPGCPPSIPSVVHIVETCSFALLLFQMVEKAANKKRGKLPCFWGHHLHSEENNRQWKGALIGAHKMLPCTHHGKQLETDVGTRLLRGIDLGNMLCTEMVLPGKHSVSRSPYCAIRFFGRRWTVCAVWAFFRHLDGFEYD